MAPVGPLPTVEALSTGIDHCPQALSQVLREAAWEIHRPCGLGWIQYEVPKIFFFEFLGKLLLSGFERCNGGCWTRHDAAQKRQRSPVTHSPFPPTQPLTCPHNSRAEIIGSIEKLAIQVG